MGSFERSNDFAAIKKDGFRHGKQRTDESEMQEGFNEGFTKGSVVGKLCGVFYAQCLLHLAQIGESDINGFKQKLKNILYDDFDVNCDQQQHAEMISKLKLLFAESRDESTFDVYTKQFENDIMLSSSSRS
mgnify:CR=1 FL=1